MDQPSRSSGIVRFGIGAGIVTGAAYWLAENLFAVVWPWIWVPTHEYAPTHLGFNLTLLSLYLCAGAVAGLLLSWVLDRAAPTSSRNLEVSVWAGLLLILDGIFLSNAVMLGGFGRPLILMSLATGTTLGLLMILGLRRPEGIAQLFVKPWLFCTLLLGLPWLMQRSAGAFLVPLAKVAASFMAITSLAWLLSALTRRFGRSSLSQTLAAHAILVVLVVGVASQARQEPLVVARGQNVEPATRSDTPNVIFVVLDTVRASHLSTYGYSRETTPNLDKFATEATLYKSAVATSDYTLPSHASMLTGLYPKAHRVRFDESHPYGRPLENAYVTLGETLVENGLATAAVVANNGYLAPYFGLFQGFQFHDYRRPVAWIGRDDVAPATFLRRRVQKVAAHLEPDHERYHVYRRAEEVNASAYDVLERVAATDQAVFLFLNYMDAHATYAPPPPFDTRFPGKDPNLTAADFGRLLYENYNEGREITDREYAHFTSQYDGELAYLDSQIGALLTRLKDLQLYDDSLVIVTSDHGEAFGGSHNLVGHAISVYQDQVHVPLLIKFPGQSEPAVVESFVSLVDLMPTVLSQLGIKIPDGLQGRDLTDSLRAEARPVFSESYHKVLTQVAGPKERLKKTQEAVFLAGRKFVLSEPGGPELFDLTQDPEERRNLVDQFEEDSTHLAALLEAWESSSAPLTQGVPQPDKATLDRLRALGYLK